MKEHIHDHYPSEGPSAHFHRVIALHESPKATWESVSELAPLLPRGWYELARLPLEDRLEFTCDFWLSQLPFVSPGGERLQERLGEFFAEVDEIGIFLTQTNANSPFDVHMVYSLQGATGFFQGAPPAPKESLALLEKRFPGVDFPSDYLAFLAIHDGFSKYTDTGILSTHEVGLVYQKLQHLLAGEMLLRPDGELIDPKSLIPFYESQHLHVYQCFYTDWHPGSEMGNVYFTEHEREISNYLNENALEDNLAFPTFLSWLVFYLEDICHL